MRNYRVLFIIILLTGTTSTAQQPSKSEAQRPAQPEVVSRYFQRYDAATKLLKLRIYPLTIGSTTYYVSTTGSDSNPCTLGSPCATPDYAFNNKAIPGDTVQVAAGTYDYGSSTKAQFTNSGTAGNYITVTCATRGACKIQNSVTGDSAVVRLQGDYTSFDGFEVTNTGTGNNYGIYVASSHVNLTRNVIHDIQTDCSSLGGGGIQLAVSSIHDFLIDSNLIYNISYSGSTPKCDSTVVQTDGILAENTGANTVITNNIIYNTSGGWGIGSVTNALIANNLVFNTVNGGIMLNNAPSGAVVENNIIVYTGILAHDGLHSAFSCAIQNGSSSSTTYGHNDLSNNFGGNYGTGWGCSDSPLNTGDIAVDPAAGTTFVNWQQNGSGDYHEKAGSPTIGAGVSAVDLYDYDGYSRGSVWDIGPYTSTSPLTASAPNFSPGAGTYSSTQTVTISTSTSGAVICYTTDGTTPAATTPGTCSHGSTYFSPVTVVISQTLQAIATESGYLNSSVGSATYTITPLTVATPTFSPAAGTYTITQTVTLSSSTGGATICYTTDGSTPTAATPGSCSAGAKYSSPITVATSQTVKAIGTEAGFTNSSVSSAAYVINILTVANPTFSPVAGTYTSTQSVTISDTTSGATIYYTTNGSTPTTSSTNYTGAISVSTTETIRAIAVAAGYANSAVASATYTITPPAAIPKFSPTPGTYSTTQSVTISDTTSGATIYYTTNGNRPTTRSTKYTGAISVSTTETIRAIVVATGYANSAVASATYTIQ